MRKILVYSAVLFIIFQLCSCFSASTDTNITPDVDISQSLEFNSYIFAVNHPIEEAYIKESRESGGSTGAMVLLYDKYAELWKAELEKYQGLIEEEIESSDEALDAFRAAMCQWRDGIEKEVDAFCAIEYYLHDNGSITGPNESKYIMELYRAQALKLIGIYEEVMVGRGWSWQGQDG